MEENKVKKEQVAPEKTMTIEVSEYEHLRAENVRLRSDMQRALTQMQQMNDVIIEKRVGFLFRVLENSTNFSDEFIQYCSKEIELSLRPVEKENK